jgi:alanine-glyoxylate transaminase/serine-glyoxylate transaminase/serine-pyruvate transaminase
VDRTLLAAIKAEGVVVAGGLHPAIKDKYFRVGHMGAVSPGDILATVGAIEKALAACGYEVELGAGLSAAQRVLAG